MHSEMLVAFTPVGVVAARKSDDHIGVLELVSTSAIATIRLVPCRCKRHVKFETNVLLSGFTHHHQC